MVNNVNLMVTTKIDRTILNIYKLSIQLNVNLANISYKIYIFMLYMFI